MEISSTEFKPILLYKHIRKICYYCRILFELVESGKPKTLFENIQGYISRTFGDGKRNQQIDVCYHVCKKASNFNEVKLLYGSSKVYHWHVNQESRNNKVQAFWFNKAIGWKLKRRTVNSFGDDDLLDIHRYVFIRYVDLYGLQYFVINIWIPKKKKADINQKSSWNFSISVNRGCGNFTYFTRKRLTNCGQKRK